MLIRYILLTIMVAALGHIAVGAIANAAYDAAHQINEGMNQ